MISLGYDNGGVYVHFVEYKKSEQNGLNYLIARVWREKGKDYWREHNCEKHIKVGRSGHPGGAMQSRVSFTVQKKKMPDT